MTSRRCLTGLVGANIMQSLSPALHEDAFAAAGIAGHYHLIDVERLHEPAGLADLVRSVKLLGFSGVNVTFPFKEQVVPLLDQVSAEATTIGAVNTVVVGADGRLKGYNTDCSGFRRALSGALGREAAEGRAVVLVGAGGAGRAVATALLDLGVSNLSIHDANKAKADTLAGE